MQENRFEPPIECLRCFLAAADKLNFRRAAATVGLSPQAFSARIAQLEQVLGASLFTRTTRSVALTSAGTRLRPHATRIMTLLAGCPASVMADARVGTEITLGTRFELGRSWLSPALVRRARAQPQDTIHLSFGDAPALQRRLVSGIIDAMVTSSRLENIPVVYEPLHDEVYAFVAAPKLLRTTPLKRRQDLKNHILLDERADLPLFRYFQDQVAAELSFLKLIYLGTIGVIRDWAVAGRGVAVLPEYLIGKDLEANRLVRVLQSYQLRADTFRLIWPLGSLFEPFLRSLAAELRGISLRN